MNDRGPFDITATEFDESEILYENPVSSGEFLLALNSYEGPLDLLLELARRHKIDLRCVSMLDLAEQYLTFIGRAENFEVQLAAEYLAMAAWLAYLKSCLLVPKGDEERDDADELSALLAARLERLELMRRMGRKIADRPRLNRDAFARGMPEVPKIRRRAIWQATLPELLRAYLRVRARDCYAPLHLQAPPAIAVEDAFNRLRSMLPDIRGWQPLLAFLPKDWLDPTLMRSAYGSMLVGALELTRQGCLRMTQEKSYAPIRLGRRDDPASGATPSIAPASTPAPVETEHGLSPS